MEIIRLHRWCFFVLVIVQLLVARCEAASSTDTTLSACDYASENLYVVNGSDPQVLFSMGFVECANATDSDAELCQVCSCREKKVASVAGVTVAWVVCVGSGDATTCTNNEASGQEYCKSSSASSVGVAGGDSCSHDSSSSCEGFSMNVGDSTSGSNINSSVRVTNGSDSSAGVHPDSNPSSSSTSVSNSSSSSIDIGASVGSNSGSIALDPVVMTISPGSVSDAENEDNVVTDVMGTVEPTQTNAAATTEQNIIRPSDNGSTNHLDTNNGSSNNSSWSGKRLTVVVSVMCGIAAVAAVAVFVAVRKNQARRKKALGTPVDEFTDDDSYLVTPMTHRLDGRYHHSRRGSRYYSNDLASSRDNTPLASIVVIGPDEDSHTPSAYATSAHQYRSYSGRKMSDGTQQRTESNVDSSRKVSRENTATTSAATFGASRRQFDVSHGPSMSDLSASRPDPIFDTNNTQVSFSSSMSSEYESPPDDPVFESEDSLTDPFRMVSATYSESTASVLSEEPQELNEVPHDGVSNTIVSFASSLSSLDSAEYDIRDTEASEHMHDSELGMMYTNSSRVAVSFDVGSISSDV